MFKKISSLVLSSLISISMVGCGNNDTSEVEYQEPQVQEEQQQEEVENETTDENLNNEYETKIQTSEVEKAVEILEPKLTDSFGEDGYIIYEYEDSNQIVIILDLPIEALQTVTATEWNEMVDMVIQMDDLVRESLKIAGLNTGSSISIADISGDTPILGVVRGEVVYDIVNGIDKLN